MENIYLEKYKKLVGNDIPNWPVLSERKALVTKYAWAIPDDDALRIIASINQPIVEIGAGTGYWSRLLQDYGCDIIAYDTCPPKRHQVMIGPVLTNQWGHQKQYIHVRKGGPNVLSNHSDRALFLCWPPYNNNMASDCLSNWNGSHLIYVGEDDGCTANDNFHQLLNDEFDLVYQYQIPQWPGIHDELFIYKRNQP